MAKKVEIKLRGRVKGGTNIPALGKKQIFNVVCVGSDILALAGGTHRPEIFRPIFSSRSKSRQPLRPSSGPGVDCDGASQAQPWQLAKIEARIPAFSSRWWSCLFNSTLIRRRKSCQLQQRHTRRSLRPETQCTQGSSRRCSPACCGLWVSRTMFLASTSTHATTSCGKMLSTRGSSIALHCRRL